MTDLRTVALTRRQVRMALRTARIAKGMSRRQAAQAAGFSPSKLIRLEDGRGALRTPDVRELVDVYEIPEPQGDLLIDAVKSVQHEPTLDRDALSTMFSPKYIKFLDLELGAVAERQWHPYAVPGLLQTDSYAEMVVREMTWRPPGERAQVRQSRMYRQEILTSGRGPRLSFLIDESVFRRVVRPKRVMREQIAHIIELTSSGFLDARVVPFDRGLHAGLHHSFVLLEFEDASMDAVFFESVSGEHLLQDDLETIARYADLLDDLSSTAFHGPRLWQWLEELSGSL